MERDFVSGLVASRTQAQKQACNLRVEPTARVDVHRLGRGLGLGLYEFKLVQQLEPVAQA
jgi:hypothetical protein